MIESFIEGRVRLRSPLLHDEELARRLSEGLLAIGGVRRAQVNRRTQGLLLEYDKDRLPLERLAPALRTNAAPPLMRRGRICATCWADAYRPLHCCAAPAALFSSHRLLSRPTPCTEGGKGGKMVSVLLNDQFKGDLTCRSLHRPFYR